MIKPGRIKEVLSEISTAAGAWATHLDIIGGGYLDVVAAMNLGGGSADNVVARITIDGTLSDTPLVVGQPVTISRDATTGLSNARYFTDFTGRRFDSSLKIELQNNDSSTRTIRGHLRYRNDL